MKYLIVLGLIFYVFYKIGSFFFRAGAASQQLRDYKQQQQRRDAAQRAKGKVKGGDYVDYEDVK